MKQNNSNAVSTAIILLIIVMVCLFSFNKCNAQDKLTLGITQDVRLALAMDSEHGNPNPTPNMIINWDWETAQFDSFYPSIKLQYEFANLGGGKLSRYSMHGGLTWNDVKTPKILFIPAYDWPGLEIGLFAGTGFLSRPGIDYVASGVIWSVLGELSYKIAPGVRLVAKYEVLNRPDLTQLYGGKNVRGNGSGGIEFDL